MVSSIKGYAHVEKHVISSMYSVIRVMPFPYQTGLTLILNVLSARVAMIRDLLIRNTLFSSITANEMRTDIEVLIYRRKKSATDVILGIAYMQDQDRGQGTEIEGDEDQGLAVDQEVVLVLILAVDRVLDLVVVIDTEEVVPEQEVGQGLVQTIVHEGVDIHEVRQEVVVRVVNNEKIVKTTQRYRTLQLIGQI